MTVNNNLILIKLKITNYFAKDLPQLMKLMKMISNLKEREDPD